MNICTIIAKNYLAHARVLSESFLEHHPNSKCFVLIIDEIDGFVDVENEPFELLRPADLDDLSTEDFDEMRANYDVLELSTAVKPWLLRHMLRHHDNGGVCYFDPDIRIYSRMEELEANLVPDSVVLTPHLTEAMPRDGARPSETDILVAGVFNLGFIGVTGGEHTDKLLRWWTERLRTDCRVAPDRGLFVDQRWIDFIPGLAEHLRILRTPTYNAAYWNVPTREISRTPSGYEINGLPLRFYHFSGYSPDRRDELSRHQNRIVLADHPVLHELCTDYADALIDAGFEEVRSLPYEHDTLPSGLPFDGLLRDLYRKALENGDVRGSPFTSAGEREFFAWLNKPAAEAPAISRYLYELWSRRAELQSTYPDVAGADSAGFIRWAHVIGRDEVPIPDELLTAIALQDRPFGVNVVGYLHSELGVGEVARQITTALDATSIPSLPVGLIAPNSRQDHAYASTTHEHNPFAVNLVCVNADVLPAFAEQAGTEFFAHHYSIGFWWWELSAFPSEYQPSFDVIDEVWVGSQFIAETLQAVSPVPVVKMPVPVEFAVPPPLSPGELNWPRGFTFMFSWDYNSVFHRKNPLAVIKAYISAFSPDEGAALVLKCINSEFDPIHHAELVAAIAGRDDIHLFDDYVTARDKNRMAASCDCYVSLHRSEGFGLTMAEAMYLGKPVVATNYSGNTEFMTADNSFPVSYTMVPVGEDAEPYPADAEWAEPDTDHAAALLREVFENRDEARRRGECAAADIRRNHSPAAAGAAFERRLHRLERAVDRKQGQATSNTANSLAPELAQLIQRGTRPRTPSRFGKPGAAARKLLLRILRPHTIYQSDVNRGLFEIVNRSSNPANLRRVEDRVDQFQATVLAELRNQGSTLERLVEILNGPEQLVSEVRETPYMSFDAFHHFNDPAGGRVFGFQDAAAPTEDADAYRRFEDLFRGSEEFVADHQRHYLSIIGDQAPVLDIGCGRGEFLDVLTTAGIDAIGVDSDEGMVARCRAKGHARTAHSDGLAYLEQCPDRSLGVVFSAQVIEQLSPDALKLLIATSIRKLKPGGMFIAETVNPHSVAALKTFWVDIAHQHPLFPETMLSLCRLAGYGPAFVFHPNGSGDENKDRFTCGEYAVVAMAPAAE